MSTYVTRTCTGYVFPAVERVDGQFVETVLFVPEKDQQKAIAKANKIGAGKMIIESDKATFIDEQRALPFETFFKLSKPITAAEAKADADEDGENQTEEAADPEEAAGELQDEPDSDPEGSGSAPEEEPAEEPTEAEESDAPPEGADPDVDPEQFS